MTRSRYTLVEAINRILRTLEGKALTVDTPEVITGDVLNAENALSDLSELLDNSLPGETLALPTALVNAVTTNLPAATTSVSGVAQLATVDEANAGTSSDTILTPQGHSWAHEYTGLYTNTGSAVQSFGAGTWVQITGAFQNTMLNSGEFGHDGGAITVNEVGTYFVAYKLSLFSYGAATTARARAYVNGVAFPATETVQTLNASGTITGIVGMGNVSVGTIGHKVDLRLNLVDANDVELDSLNFVLQKLVG